jgi:hypothetical protein
MKNVRRLTYKMNSLLRGIRDRPVVLPALLEREKVKRVLWMRWLRHPVFRDSLDEVVRERRVALRLDLELLAAAAAEHMATMLAQAKAGGKTPDRRIVALCDAIMEAYDRTRLFYRRRRHACQRRVLPPALADLCHPNAKGDEDELLARLAAPDEPAEVLAAEAAEREAPLPDPRATRATG